MTLLSMLTGPQLFSKITDNSLETVCRGVRGWGNYLRLDSSVVYFTTVVLYGCETWSLTLREEHRLRVFENRVLRKIFGPKRDEVTGEWRK
jgi:hypothetical protein